MVKGLKPIIITGVIVILLVAGSLLLIFMPSAEAEEEGADPVETTGSSTVYIIKEDSEAVVAYELIPADGDAMRVDIDRGNPDSLSYSVTPATEYFEYDTSKLRSMTFTLSSLSAARVVEEDAKDLSLYGLDTPSHTVRTIYSDGRVIELYIGNQTIVDNYYYIMSNQSGDVYSIGSYTVGLVTRTDLDFRQITIFPTYTEDAIYENIEWFRLTLRDGTEIEILHDTEVSTADDPSATEYRMFSPAQAYGNTTLIQELLDDLALLSVSSVYMDITEDDYAEYGLNNPARLEMRDIAGKSVDLLVGKETYSGSGYYFCALASAPNTVLIVDGAAMTWFNTNYIELMNRIIWLYSITDIATMEYDLDGEKHVIELEHSTKINTNDVEVGVVDATMDGEFLSETNARRLYIRSVNFRIAGDLTSEQIRSLGKTAGYTVTFGFLDGSSSTLELIKLNDRQYACRVDGETLYYTNVKNIQTLISAFETVAAGGELARSYDSY